MFIEYIYKKRNKEKNEMEKVKKVIPCGMLYSQGREYFLIHNKPISKDDWQGDNLYRWAVVPRKPLSRFNPNHGTLYPHARHIVTNAFVVDFTELPEIEINVLDEYDLAALEGEPINPENVPFNEWLNTMLEQEDNDGR